MQNVHAQKFKTSLVRNRKPNVCFRTKTDSRTFDALNIDSNIYVYLGQNSDGMGVDARVVLQPWTPRVLGTYDY